MALHYGIEFGRYKRKTIKQAEIESFERLNRGRGNYQLDSSMVLYRVEAVRYSGCQLTAYDTEEYYVTDPVLEMFAFPVIRFTTHGATIAHLGSTKWVDLRGDNQWASRTGEEAVRQLRLRRERQLYILNKQLDRAKREMKLCEYAEGMTDALPTM